MSVISSSSNGVLRLAIRRQLVSQSDFKCLGGVAKRAIATSCVLNANPRHWRVGPKEYWNKGEPNYEYRWARGRKVAKVNLPKFDEERNLHERLSPEEIRSHLKKDGVIPHRSWNQRPIAFLASNDVFDAFVPLEGDGKHSKLTKEGALDTTQWIGKKTRSQLALRKIRSFHEHFDAHDFAQGQAFDIYKKVHELLAKGEDLEQLHEFATGKAFADMTHNIYLKTIRWQLIRNIDEPRMVHVRVEDLMEKGQQFAQVTVRFHSQQMLAIYDRFGRLQFGSEAALKDVLEYVVFEQHLNDIYGSWKLHAKIIPDWLPKKTPILRTFRKPKFEATSEEEKAKKREEAKKKYEENENLKSGEDKDEEGPVRKNIVARTASNLMDRFRNRGATKHHGL